MLTWMSILLWFICMVAMPNRQERYTTTRTSKENCTERMQPSGTIRYADKSFTIHINHNNVLIQVSMLMLISYIFLQSTCTSGRCTSFKTPDDGRLRPKHVE